MNSLPNFQFNDLLHNITKALILSLNDDLIATKEIHVAALTFNISFTIILEPNRENNCFTTGSYTKPVVCLKKPTCKPNLFSRKVFIVSHSRTH